MNFYTDPLLDKLRLIESGQPLNEGLSPEEKQELDSLYKELAGWGGVDSEMDTLISAYKKLPAGGDTTTTTPDAKKKIMAPVDPGTVELQKWLISKGYNLGPDGADGRWGKNTQKGIDAFWADWQAKKISKPDQDQYQKLLGAAKDTEWTRYWFSKQKAAGAATSTAAGAATQPAAGATGSGAIPADANKKEPYWVNGTRYEWGTRGWKATAQPGDAFQWNSTRARSMTKFTGPDSAYQTGGTATAAAPAPSGAATQPSSTEKRTPAEIKASQDLKKAGV
jgi:peptidoglycan hydrolase-like protein with peptidoglycan-binding domain